MNLESRENFMSDNMEIKKRSLKVNAILNVIKQMCSIIFPMITFPYASRVLGTYNYGKINFGSSIISYITLIAALGISTYAIREGAKVRNDHDKLSKLCNELFSINIISTIVAYVVLFFLIIFWKRLDGYVTLLIIQSLTVLFTTIGTDWINSIYEDYLFLTIRYLICQTISLILMFIIVKSRNDYLNYAFTSVINIVLANIINIGYIRKTYKLHPKFTTKINARKHMKPIMALFGSGVALMIYINSDVTILGIFKGEKEVGLYSVSAKIYNLVKQLLNALLIVSIPRISHEIGNFEQNVVEEHLGKILHTLLLIIFPASVGLLMLSKNIILLFSGNQYINAYSSLQILSLALIFATIACFFINVVMVPYNQEGRVLFATAVSAIANIVLNVIFIPFWGQNAAAVTTLIAEMIMTFMGIYYTRKLIRIKIKMKKPLLIGLGGGIVVGLACFLVLNLLSNIILQIIVSVFVSVILFVIYTFVADRQIFYYFSGMIKSKVK